MKIETKHFDVSVILTIYNSRQFYKRALDSILNQTFENYEIVIIDDGSTDNVENELLPVVKVHDNIKYLRHSNRRHPLSLNSGIAISSGKFLSFLDSDDEYEVSYLEERINFFLKNPGIDLIYSPATIIGKESDFFVPDANDTSKLVHLDDCVIGGTFFGKRNVFTSLEGFRNVYSHDSEFFSRASANFKIARFDSRTYKYYRDNPESVISKLKSQKAL